MAVVSSPNDGNVLECRLRSYETFLAVTMLLKEALEREAYPEVSRLVERREALIEAMGDPVRVGLSGSASLDRPVPADGERSALTEEIEGTLRRILAMNQECETLAARRLGSIQESLQATHQVREGVQGYAPKKGRTDQFLNVKL